MLVLLYVPDSPKVIITANTVAVDVVFGYYGLSVISVTVTKGEHLRGSGLYGTSGTIGRGVAELHN